MNKLIVYISFLAVSIILLLLYMYQVSLVFKVSSASVSRPRFKYFKNKYPKEPILLDMSLLPKLRSDYRLSANDSIAIHKALAVPLIDTENRKTNNVSYYIDDLKFNHIKIFLPNGALRIIPRIPLEKIGSILVPKDPGLFLECWKRSHPIPCLGIEMNRKQTAREIPQLEGVRELAKLTQQLFALRTFPFLVCGTQLGWYRECGIIPHTTDLDIAIMAEEYRKDIVRAFSANTSADFKLMRILGKPDDNYELTVLSTRDKRIRVDIFLMYSENNTMWIGATDANKLIKFHYEYPRVKNFCSTLLLGYHFWVNCDVEEILTVEYGDWKKDWNSNSFSYKESARNTKIAGSFKEKERSQVIQNFR